MSNPAPTLNQINAFNATQGTTIDFNIIGGTEVIRSNKIYIYDLSDNSLICTHLYVSTESMHELPPNTSSSIVYASGKSSADFVNGAQYYAQIQTFTDIAGTQGGSGLSVSKLFWCLVDPSLIIATIPSSISTTSYNVSATYNANTSVVSNIIQQYQFNLYSATGSLLQSSGVVVGNGEQQGTSTAYDISYNFSGLEVGSSYYVVVNVTTTQGMSVNAQSSTFTVSIDTPTLGEATVVNNACDGYISVTSNLSSEYGGSASGEIATFETDSVNNVTKLEVELDPIQLGEGTPSPSNVRPIVGHSEVAAKIAGKNLFVDDLFYIGYNSQLWENGFNGETVTKTDSGFQITTDLNYGFGAYLGYFDSGVTFTVSFLNSGINAGQNFSIRKTTTNQLSKLSGLSATRLVQKGIVSGANSLTFTTDEKCHYWLGLYDSTIGASHEQALLNVQLERGSTATDYVPYVEPIEVEESFNVTLTPTIIDETSYLFKKTGDVRGDRESLELVGGTVNWNQLAPAIDNTKWNGNSAFGTSTFGTNKITYTITSKNGSQAIYCGYSVGGVPLTKGHKYLLGFYVTSSQALPENLFRAQVMNSQWVVLSPVQANKRTYISAVFESTNETGGNSYFGIFPYVSVGLDVGATITVEEIVVTDLTSFFGNSSTADYISALTDPIAWLRKYFPDLFAYSPYNTGTLESVKPTAHVTRGVNQWDEEWELGDLNTSNGQNYPATNRIRSKNYIRVLPNTTYYFKSPYNSIVCFYDANKNFVNIGNATLTANATFTTQSNVHYMRISPSASYGTTYNHDICINLSWDGERDGEYEAYVKHSYALDSDLVLRGIPKLDNGNLYYDGDTYESDGTVTRKYGIVDLGTLTWVTAGANTLFRTTDLNLLIRKASSGAEVFSWAVCSDSRLKFVNYNTIGTTTPYDICVSITGTLLATLDTDATYTDASFKSAMSGVYLVYELATPTTETAEPFTDPQEVSIYGTEEFVSSNGVPVGNKTTYKTRDIFGGKIDLASGVLTVDKVSTILNGSESWEYGATSKRFYMNKYDMEEVNHYDGNADWLDTLENFDGFGIRFGYGNKIIYLCGLVDNISAINDLATLKTYLASHNLQICYPLATPLTYQLTPHEIETLIGTNNVWSNAGDVSIEFHIPITNLLVKRQDVDDVSGNWLTLYSQPVEQASDMDFTFIDFLNQYGKKYKYALVPLLTQTQSGVEVEVEGGYTVSDEVQSVFDGVFIVDSTGSQKCKANVGYGNVDMNQTVGTITPIGAKYPVVITNSKNQYHNGSISGTIVPDDYYFNGNLSRIDMVNKRDELEQFLTNKRAKIIKDWNGKIWLVMIMDNVSCTFNNNYGMGIVNFSTNWVEVGDPTNQQDLQATGLINVGGV